jgi:hypothetical protein
VDGAVTLAGAVKTLAEKELPKARSDGVFEGVGRMSESRTGLRPGQLVTVRVERDPSGVGAVRRGRRSRCWGV